MNKVQPIVSFLVKVINLETFIYFNKDFQFYYNFAFTNLFSHAFKSAITTVGIRNSLFTL